MIWILWALGIPLGYAVFQAGGVDPAHWNPCCIAIGALGLAAVWVGRNERPRPLDRISLSCIAVASALSVFQLVPLPVTVIRYLSPNRYIDLHPPAALGLAVPAWAPLSSAPTDTAQYLVTLGACLVVLFLARHAAFAEADRPFILAWPLLLIGAAEAAIGMAQAYSGSDIINARGTYASYDHYAALLELILPFALMYPIALLRRSGKRHESPALPAIKACALLAIAALILVAIVHSLSRMGFLTVLSELAVCGLVALVVRPRSPELHRVSPWWYRLLPVIIVATVGILGFIYLPTDPLIARFSDLAHTDDIMTADVRAQIWRDTTRMFYAYPWFGCGWGAYQWTFLRFKTVAPMNTVDYAHNDYLQILVEAGVFVFLAGMIFVLRVLYRVLRAPAWSYSPDERYFAIACAGSISAILLHSFVDFNLYVPANAIVFSWVLGFSAVHLRRCTRRQP